MNKERCEQVLSWIEAHPEHWDQSVWHCGTTHCFAGVAEMMRHGWPPEKAAPNHVSEIGELSSPSKTRAWLGLSWKEWHQVTWIFNTIDDLRRIIRGTEC